MALTVMPDSLTVVERSGDEVRWGEAVQREPGIPLADAACDAIRRAPAARRRQVRMVYVAASAAYAHVRCIAGLPAAKPASLRAIIGASSSRYFPAAPGTLVVGGIRAGTAGLWVAAYDATFVEGVRSGCERAGIRQAVIVPLACSIGAGCHTAAAAFRDERMQMHATYDERWLLSTLEKRHAPEREAGGAEAPPLEAALGASRVAPIEPLALRLRLGGSGIPSKTRIAAAAVAFGLSLAALLLTPAFRAAHERDTLAAKLRALAPARDAALRDYEELGRATSGLAELASFDRDRRPVLPLLVRITRALPPGSALVEFKLDSAGGIIVVVAPRAADVVSGVDHLHGITAPTIVGPVTPEQPTVPGHATPLPPMERVTIHFQLAQPGR